MGGQLALHWAATHAGQVARLVLIATTPCFVRGPDWEHGMEAPYSTVSRTIWRRMPTARCSDSRCCRRAATPPLARSRAVCRRVPRARHAEQAALVSGLELLRTTDLRSTLPAIAQPALIVHGEHDAVVPLRAGEYLQRNLPHAELAVIEGAAHAPFIAQPRAVAQRIAEFCHG